jgi:hypothetical protein
MKVDSLDELKVAFVRWRRAKRHLREAVPEELLVRARRAAEVHGVKEVVRAIRVERSRLFRRGQGEEATAASTPARPARPALPAFSRLALTSPVVGAQPIAELQTPAGVKLRVFVESPAMMGLLSGLCVRGGAA